MLHVKVVFNGEIRRAVVDVSRPFRDVMSMVTSLFGLDERQMSSAAIRYTDNEGCLVTVSSQPEFDSAVAMTKAAADGSKLLKLTITGVAESPSRDVADPTKNSKLAEMLHYGETQYLTTPAAIEHFVCMISQEIARISQFLPRETVTAMRCEEMTGTRKMLPVLYNVASDPLTARNFITDFPLFPPFALEFLSSIQPSTFPPTCPATTNTNITASIPTPIPMAFHQPPQQLLPPLSSPLFPSLFRSPFPLGNPLFPVIPTSTSMLPPTPATTKSPFAETEEERRANAALVSMGFADERQNMTYVRAYNSIPMAIAALLEKRNAAQQATSQHV